MSSSSLTRHFLRELQIQIDKMGDFDNPIGMSRLTIEIEPEQHRLIKTLATFEGMTIKEYILSRTLPPKAKAPDTTETLLSHPENKARLLAAIETPREDYFSFETMEQLKDALGI